MECLNCGFQNKAEAGFCQNCGRALSRTCPSCSAANDPEANFCFKCGAVLIVASTQTAEVRQPSRHREAPRSQPEQMPKAAVVAASRPEGQRKPVTILFLDIVGSTSLAERLDPEEWREVVNGTHQRVIEAVHRYKGTIAQLLGDGVLAFFGAPVTYENDPERALRAALDIQEAMRRYGDDLEGLIENFQVRIGVNTGLVVAGDIGDELHMEYLAVGESVNLAARLQSAATPGKVLISEATARQVQPIFELEDLGKISVKGISEPVEVYEVVSLKRIPESRRGIAGLTSPIVGRDNELNTLQEALDALREGKGRIAFVLGEAGLGKSRLVDEMCHRTQVDIRWLEGRALSYGETLPFWSIVQLIKNDLGVSETDPEVRLKAALSRRLRALFGDKSRDIEPYLSHLLGFQSGGPATPLAILDGENLKYQTLQSIAAYFAALALEKPTVLVFEDLHWADPSSLETLENLFAVTDRVPLCLLMLARIDRDHGSWGLKLKAETDFAHRYTEILLRQLSEADSSLLMANLLQVLEMSPEMRSLLLGRAEGNPFYLEEITRSLIETSLLIQENGRWRLTDKFEQIVIPESLQALLLARIDRLQDDLRRTLQQASVIGRSFLYRLLKAITEAEGELDQNLSRLQRVDLVREKTRRPELEYIFKHALTQEAAYNSLLLERRRGFHRQVAEALEKMFQDRREEYLGLLAHHFAQAGDRNKAVEYLLQAGDKTRNEDALEESIQYYQRAIQLLTELGEDERAAKTWLKLGLVYHLDFRFEQAHQANETAFHLQQQAAVRTITNIKNPMIEERLFRAGVYDGGVKTLDPGKCTVAAENLIVSDLFEGIADLDEESNIVPRGAVSWEVLDGGRRYLIHLRQDFFWTDSSPVTAKDYEWAWKRNLRATDEEWPQSLLDDVLGAREYRQGRSQDPDSVGVRALDEYTLQVVLENPVAFFPYLLAHTITFPQPRGIIERFGNDWWLPENLVCNGPFLLTHFEPQELIAYERNPIYPGIFSGNITRVEWWCEPSDEVRENLFQQQRYDFAETLRSRLTADLASFEDQSLDNLTMHFIELSPWGPMADVRVRRALAHALDRDELARQFHHITAGGGAIPPGMPGHSPGIGLTYDPALARRLLAEAGYPGGRQFPSIHGVIFTSPQLAEIFQSFWRENLGIEISLEFKRGSGWDPESDKIYSHGWLADYPDPDNFLRRSIMIDFLHSHGWHDPYYEDLVLRAAETSNRSGRMRLYREADRYLVAEQVFVIPLSYRRSEVAGLKQPWVEELGSPMGLLGGRYFRINDQPERRPR